MTGDSDAGELVEGGGRRLGIASLVCAAVFAVVAKHGGRVVRTLQDPSGRTFAFVTNAVEHDGALYLGSLTLPYAGRLPLR